MTRLVAVSNRICVPGHPAAPGGVAASLQPTMRARGGLWFGWDGHTCAAHDRVRSTHEDGVTYASMRFSPREYADFYLGFCNSTLWPLLHSLPDRSRFSRAQYVAYERMNLRFAAELVPMLRPDDVIWVHDYHLLLLARSLREAGCEQRIGLFLHTPFPALDILRTVPVHDELIRAMLAYDLVGFQTESDREAFHGAGGQRGVTGVFPVGVDVDAIHHAAASTDAHRVGRLMLGVDRLDYTKGLPERITAFEQFRRRYPETDLTFVQIAALSRTDLPDYATLRRDLLNAQSRLGEQVLYLTQGVDHTTLMGLMRRADIGLVTPVRDGMNLVAKEFVAAQDPADPGVLILSRFAGAARELTHALLVNPHDPQAMAEAIQHAATMPVQERRARHRMMIEVLRRNCLSGWHTSFLEALRVTPPCGWAAVRTCRQ